MSLRAGTETSETFRNIQSINLHFYTSRRLNKHFILLDVLAAVCSSIFWQNVQFVKTQTAHDVYWTSGGRRVLFRSGSLYDNSRGKMQFTRIYKISISSRMFVDIHVTHKKNIFLNLHRQVQR